MHHDGAAGAHHAFAYGVFVERGEGAQVDHLNAVPVFGGGFGGGKRHRYRRPVADEGYVLAGATNSCLPNRQRVRRGIKVTLFPVQTLGFVENHRVVAANRLAQHMVGIRRVGRGVHVQPGSMRGVPLRTVAVMLHGTHPAAVGHAHHHGHGEIAARAVAHFRQVAHHLFKGGVPEGVKLHLDHGAEPVHRHADRGPHNSRLRDGGVEAAFLAKPFGQPVGHTENTAEGAYVHAEHHHAVVMLHFVTQGQVEGAHH